MNPTGLTSIGFLSNRRVAWPMYGRISRMYQTRIYLPPEGWSVLDKAKGKVHPMGCIILKKPTLKAHRGKSQKPEKKEEKMPVPKDYPGGIVKRAKELKDVRLRAYELMQQGTISSYKELRKALEKEFGITLPSSTVSTWYNNRARKELEPKASKKPIDAMSKGSEHLSHLKIPMFKMIESKPNRVQLTVGYRSLTLEEADVSLTSKILAAFLTACQVELAIALRDTLGRDMRLDDYKAKP